MRVCIAEKPSVAQDIAKVIGATGGGRSQGYFEGNGYYVTWVFGHLCELKEPHDYKPFWKSWNKYDLPIMPERFGIKLKNDKGVERQFNTIKYLVEKSDEVINCGDAGQEGELIQRWVLLKTGINRPMRRLWISSLTEEAIREGFDNLRNGSDFDRLYSAGNARAIGDWLLGMNATRAFTLTYGKDRQVLSIGRVQTPTLALIVQRYNEIQNFVPETYWELKTKYRGVTFSSTRGRFGKKEEAEAALQTIVGTDFRVTDVQTKEGNEAPPQLFDLTSLQVECNRKYAFSADDTLKIVQSLYEKKLSTYPRVDTRYLSDDIYPKVPQILSGIAPYRAYVEPLLGQKMKKSKKVFDNSKVTDHHAIIPTGVAPKSDLPRNEKLVYDLIARRFIANFYADSRVSTTTVMGRAADVEFKCTGKQILSAGWRVLYEKQRQSDDEPNESDEDFALPAFGVGESGPHEPGLQEKQTQAPKPYTEGTLLKAMETAGKQVEDEELRLLMKENGIGRPSTRAAIIETLCKRRYIVRERKNLTPTVTGLQLISLIKNELLKSVELTGKWEKKLREIEKGTQDPAQFLDEMRQMVTQVVSEVVNDRSGVRVDVVQEQQRKGKKTTTPATESKAEREPKAKKEEVFVCPRCGKPILKGKSAWGCSGYRDGCTVIVPFEVYGKKLTDAQVRSLFKKSETGNIKGLVVNGEPTEGKLAFDSSFSIVIRPAADKTPDVSQLQCPTCGSPLLTGKTAWGCSGYASGCSFRVPFAFMGKALTATHLGVLVKKRKTGVINGFKTPEGRKFSGRLVLGEDGQLKVEE